VVANAGRPVPSIAPPAVLRAKALAVAAESKPLFHPEVPRQQVRSSILPEHTGAWRPKLQHWAGLITSGRADEFKETALFPGGIPLAPAQCCLKGFAIFL
jgi:hypothetical protein